MMLLHIQRGEFGMDLAMKYMERLVHAGFILWDAAEPKFSQLVTEIQQLMCVFNLNLPRHLVLTKSPLRMFQKMTQQTRIITHRNKPPSLQKVFDAAGRECISDTERGEGLKQKRKHKEASASSKPAVPVKPPALAKTSKQPAKKSKANTKKKSRATQSDPEDIDSGDESDGRSALRGVETQEEAEKSKGARTGPQNTSMQHFRDPIAVKDNNKQRWQFNCKYCNA
ncbi:hypothetical protein VKT23_003044 [Stygiomarasmius scandens]|uniref:Uncharacterized protein n=1 Tax=Marasmiellus scandens TaxID=2682957 RepID=A0ABR1JW00_9AGAR